MVARHSGIRRRATRVRGKQTRFARPSPAIVTRPPMKLRRFIVSSLCAMVVAFGMFLWLGYWYGDLLDANLRPSFFEVAFQRVCLVVCWPFVATSWLLGHDPSRIVSLLLWIATGLFWGFVMETFLIVKNAHKGVEGVGFLACSTSGRFPFRIERRSVGWQPNARATLDPRPRSFRHRTRRPAGRAGATG